MVVVTSATFGDEFSSTDVLKTIQDKLKADGAVSIPVNSSILPLKAKAFGADAKLSPDEQEEIKETAANMCGAADQTCLELKMQELAQQKLKEKASQVGSSADIVRGRRLTMRFRDESGKEQTVKIPEGQVFELGELKKDVPGKADPAFDWNAVDSPYRKLFSSWWTVLGSSILIFVYATSIIVTWMTYIKHNTRLIAIVMTAIAAVIPYSGFALSFGAGLVPGFIETTKELQRKVDAESSG